MDEPAAQRTLSFPRTAAADLGADIAEGVVGVAAQHRDGGDTHHDKQGQHDCLLDGSRAVLVLQESAQTRSHMLEHGSPPDGKAPEINHH